LNIEIQWLSDRK